MLVRFITIPKVPKIPAAAISIEDALMIERLVKEGSVSVHIQMDAHMEPEVQAGNVIGEIVGSEHPDQVVVLGGHIDSWDVGQGAQDDGSGIMGTYAAVSLLHKLGLKPKRTIRLVFWVNEENGGAGGRAYRELVRSSIDDQVAAIEMDSDAEKPLGMAYGNFGGLRRQPHGALGAPAPITLPVEALDLSSLAPDEMRSFALLRDIASLLMPIGADAIFTAGGGADIAPITNLGVPSLSPQTTQAHYFDWHHTEADTLDKVNPDDFRKNVAMLAVVAYVLADMDGRLMGQMAPAED